MDSSSKKIINNRYLKLQKQMKKINHKIIERILCQPVVERMYQKPDQSTVDLDLYKTLEATTIQTKQT